MEDTRAETLYERIGGSAAIDAAVDLLYDKILLDRRLRRFFDGVDIAAQKRKQRAFLSFVFGGPSPYDGVGLRRAHARSREQGLGEEHFAAVAGHLAATLEELGVERPIAAEVMAIALSTRSDVLGRGPDAD